MLHKTINNALYVGKVAHDYLVKCTYSKEGDDVQLMSPTCLYSAYIFSRDFIPKHSKLQVVQEATHDWILWNSPVARNLWRECKTILHAIKIPSNCDSYYSAILALDDPNLQHADDDVDLRAIIKQNLITYSLWALR